MEIRRKTALQGVENEIGDYYLSQNNNWGSWQGVKRRCEHFEPVHNTARGT
jgi:hypothetical protein